LEKNAQITLIGDAAHPMSPFKGQEQIKHYWIALARSITRECRPLSQWREADKESVLTEFESEMLERSAIKVKHSAEAAQFYILKLCLRVMSLEDAVLTRKRGIIINTINLKRAMGF
jgi:hypothetical protein